LDLNVFLDSNIFSDINLINRLFFSVGFETQRRRSIKERWGVKVILRKEIWSCFIVILHITIKMRSSMMSMTPITMTLVRDSSAFQRLFFSDLLEPWDVRELYIRKTADLPLQLCVDTFPRFVAIGFYFLSETLI
jgi:hypothetical protein